MVPGGETKRKEQSMMLAKARLHYVNPTHIAGAYIGLGDKNQVLSWLERGFEERDEEMVWMKVAPDLDFVRFEPRFQALLRRMNLAP